MATKLTLTIEQKRTLYPKVQNFLNSTGILRSGSGSISKPNILVVGLQEALIALGFELPTFGVDGIFGSETKAAVEAYQRASRLTADGIVGGNTRNAFFIDLQPPPLPKDPKKVIENRIQTVQLKQTRVEQSELVATDVEVINNAVAEDQKPKGLQRLGSLVLKQSIKLSKFVVPLVFNLIKEYSIDQLEARLEEEVSNSAEQQEKLKAEFCNINLPSIIEQRNNAVEYLNNTGKVLDSFTLSVNFGADFAGVLTTLIKILKGASFGINQALKIPGTSALPFYAPAQSIATDLNTIADTVTFKADGTPNVPPLSITAAQVSPAFASAQSTIVKCVDSLDKLDILIALCDPNATLTPLSDSINNIYDNELLAESSENGNIYKGFVLEIETRPYTDRVDQNRAVGKNKSDITLISTDYSFASNPQVLIDELKFIIDRDDLKAY
jgi:hypothetical protein